MNNLNAKTETVQLETINETRVYKSLRDGWQADSLVKWKGVLWQVTTMKRYNGRLSTTAQQVRKNGGMISFTMFQDANIGLVTSTTRATEKSVKEQHEAGLQVLKQKAEAGQLPTADEYEIKVGQILVNQDNEKKKAVYKIDQGFYFWVNLETLALGRTEDFTVNSINKRHGIGTYYVPDMHIEESELTPIVEKAVALRNEQHRKEQEERARQKAEIQRKIEEGEKLVQTPHWAKAVIVANYKKDTSDPLTDYFAHTTEKTVFLAYSPHTRDIFQEMRKAAANYEETAFLADAPASFENRQKYSMGAGYWLGEHSHGGWEIRKEKLKTDECTYGITQQTLYLAAAEGKYFCDNSQEQPHEPAEAIQGDFTIIDYSGKAIALKGDTKPIKDQLKSLGGRFNPRLTDPQTGKRFVGWIFPKSKQEALQSLIQ